MIAINEGLMKDYLNEVGVKTAEDTLDGLLDVEGDQVSGDSTARINTRAGECERLLDVKAGYVTLIIPKLRSRPFEGAVINRYGRPEISVEEALVKMYLTVVSVRLRRVKDVIHALWGSRVSRSAGRELSGKLAGQIEGRRHRPAAREHAYVFLDGIWLKRFWGEDLKSVDVLVAIRANEDGYRELLGLVEGAKKDSSSWTNFLRYLKERGLCYARLFVSHKCLVLLESAIESYPAARWTAVPSSAVRTMAGMLKAMHVQEHANAATERAELIVADLGKMKLAKASELIGAGIEEPLRYFALPTEHWRSVRTNNPFEPLMHGLRQQQARSSLLHPLPRRRGTLWATSAIWA